MLCDRTGVVRADKRKRMRSSRLKWRRSGFTNDDSSPPELKMNDATAGGGGMAAVGRSELDRGALLIAPDGVAVAAFSNESCGSAGMWSSTKKARKPSTRTR